MAMQFINDLIEGNFALGPYLKQVSHHITITHCDTNILFNIHQFLNVESKIYGNLLLEMSKEHYHSKDDIKCKYHEES